MEKKRRNYRLLKDPLLDDKVQQKLYRFDGLLPGEHIIDVKDPRRRSNSRSNPRYLLWTSRQVMDLEVPKFKYDQHYIGIPPPNEVTFTNLNDNIDFKFLENMCQHFGSIEEIKIYHHPKTKKHLGIGKVLFTSSKCAKACVDKLNQTSKMGNIITVIIDIMGKERNRIIEEILADKPKSTRRPQPSERVDPRSHSRLYATAATSSNRSSSSRNFSMSKSKYSDYGMEAYDPGDLEFDFGSSSSHHQPSKSVETVSFTDSDYGSLQRSVSQSELSFSDHSEVFTPSSYSNYSQYSSSHVQSNRALDAHYNVSHAPPYQYSGSQYTQPNSNRQVLSSYCQLQPPQPPQPPPPPPQPQQTHYDGGHLPVPAEVTQSQTESSSRSHSYSERKDEYKDKAQQRWESERDSCKEWTDSTRDVREKQREKDHRNRPKTPDADEPRNQSLDSRLLSIFGLAGLGSPTESSRAKDHSSPPSTPLPRDEAKTPPSIESRYCSTPHHSVPSRNNTINNNHTKQVTKLPYEEESKHCVSSKNDSSNWTEYSKEMSNKTKRYDTKNNCFTSLSKANYEQQKLDKVTPADGAISCKIPSNNVPSRYKSEVSDKLFEPEVAIADFSNVSQSKSYSTTDSSFHGKGMIEESSASNIQSNMENLPMAIEMDNETPEDMDVVEKDEQHDGDDDDDDDDRMSLSSISSGDEKLEVNVQLPSSDTKFTANSFQSIPSTQAPPSAPPVPLITDFSRPPPSIPPWNFGNSYSFSNYLNAPNRSETSGSNYNQSYTAHIQNSVAPANFLNQSLGDTTTLQNGASSKGSGTPNEEKAQPDEEKDPNDKTFLFVLDNFVRQLKEVMQKDLCKKMVENSAFKSFEKWWDAEEQKSKFQKENNQNEKVPLIKDSPIKNTKPNTTPQTTNQVSGKNEVNSTLAPLFETQHPWRQEGGFDNHYNGSHGGGFLGIRGVMPRMPSFKKKVFRPPSPPPPDDEDSKAAESFASNAEDDSDDDDDDVNIASQSVNKKKHFISEESVSEDEKSEASDDEDEDDEDEDDDEEDDDGSEESSEEDTDEDEEESSESSEEGSEEDDEEEEEEEEGKIVDKAESQTLQESTADFPPLPSTEQEDEVKTTAVAEELSEENNLKETLKEVCNLETSVSNDSKPELPLCHKPPSSSDKEEMKESVTCSELESKESVVSNEDVKDPIETNNLEKPDVSIDSENKVDDKVSLSESEHYEITPQVSATEAELTDATTSEKSGNTNLDTFSNKPSNVWDEADEERNSVMVNEMEVPVSEISSEMTTTTTTTTTTDEDTSKVDRLKAHIVPAIAEHDYVAPGPQEPSPSTSFKVDDAKYGVREEEDDDGDVDDEDDSDRTESCDEDNPPVEIFIDHNYCLPRENDILHDENALLETEGSKLSETAFNGYKLTDASGSVSVPNDSQMRSPRVGDNFIAGSAVGATLSKSQTTLEDERSKQKKKKKRTKDSMLSDITNKSVIERDGELKDAIVKPKVKFQPRTYQENKQLFFDIYNKGIDLEDIAFLQRTYDTLLQSEDPMYDWLNDIFWVDHTHTDIPDPLPPKKKRKTDEQMRPVHKSGSARTEGFYKISNREKAGYLCHANNMTKAAEIGQQNEKKLSMTSREARHNIRRFQTNFGDLELGELFKFNQLKFRKKQLRFAKSSIHDWGLFALEPIAAEEMVIEYVGQVIRHFVADEREKQYGAQGIGSSYLFRVDNETIIDATKAGNLARFINHSCNPNCYAKIITVESHKKIVIYSKRDIDVNEEITYDYKFPLEEEKISCLCGAPYCKGTLN
ncbi:histone-lysine N-methyltransferase SETD1-like isoform X1 [Argonauta hians]